MKFKVKNLPKYKKANYPSYKELGKLDLSRYSFPFSKGIKILAAAAALSTGFSATSWADNEPAPPIKEVRPIPQGRTGGIAAPPVMLSEREVSDMVVKVFAEAGLAPKVNVAYKDDKVECELDVYDATQKVGFEFIMSNDYEERKCAPEKGFSKEEMEILKGAQRDGAAHIMAVSDRDSAYRPRGFRNEAKVEALKNLEKAVKQYLKQLKEQGIL